MKLNFMFFAAWRMRRKAGQNHPWDILMLLYRDSAHGLIHNPKQAFVYINMHRII